MVDERITTFVSMLAVISDVVGYGIPYWIKIDDLRIGLWQACFHRSWVENEKEKTCFTSHPLYDKGWFQATKIVETFGLVFAVCTTIIIVCTNCVAHKRLRYLALLITFGSACLVGSGVIIFGVKQQEYLHAAYGLSASAAFLYIVIFILLICTRNK